MTLTIAIYVFDEVELLDFAGPYEVFTTATRVHARVQPDAAPLFAVQTIGRTSQPVRARAGLAVTPDGVLQDANTAQVLIVPGGIVTAELAKRDLVEWIAHTAPGRQITASVCTGAFLLAEAGLLEGRMATTHWEDIDDLTRAYPNVRVARDRRWVDEGRLVTSGGISAGLDMALHLVARLAGRELAVRTARQMEYVWSEA